DSYGNIGSEVETVAYFPYTLGRVIRSFLNSSAYISAHIFDRITEEQAQPYDPYGPVDCNGNGDPWTLDSVSKTQWQYDTLSLTPRSGTVPGWVDPGSSVRGNATVVKKYITTGQFGTFVTTTQQYDVLGNLVTLTDP